MTHPPEWKQNQLYKKQVIATVKQTWGKPLQYKGWMDLIHEGQIRLHLPTHPVEYCVWIPIEKVISVVEVAKYAKAPPSL